MFMHIEGDITFQSIPGPRTLAVWAKHPVAARVTLVSPPRGFAQYQDWGWVFAPREQIPQDAPAMVLGEPVCGQWPPGSAMGILTWTFDVEVAPHESLGAPDILRELGMVEVRDALRGPRGTVAARPVDWTRETPAETCARLAENTLIRRAAARLYISPDMNVRVECSR